MLDKVLAYVTGIDGVTNEDLCVVTWRSVFGPAFADEEKARALASRAAGFAAGIKIAPGGAVVPRTDPQPGMSSPSHRFWGHR
jgi:hypothetical protein